MVADTLDELTRLREEIEDLREELERSEAQNETLENVVFGVEKEYDRARAELMATQQELAERKLQQTQAELERSYAELRSVKAQQDDILENIEQGIVTVNPDGSVNAESSRRARQIFAKASLAGTTFTSFFADEDLLERVQRYLESLFKSPWMSRLMVANMNPLAEYRPVASEQVYAFKFARIFEREGLSGNQARVAKVLVLIEDRSLEFALNRKLEVQAREQARQIEQVYQVLMLPADTFQQFLREADTTVHNVELDLPTLQAGDPALAQVIMSRLHRLKGSAASLNLTLVVESVHRLEQTVHAFVPTARTADADMDTLRAALEKLRRDVADQDSLFAKMLNMRGTDATVAAPAAVSQVETVLQGLVRREATRAAKAVVLAYDDDNPTLHQSMLDPLKDVLVQLVRNAIAHGIEATPTRTQRGKAHAGHIDVKVRHEGEQLLVVCRDDGNGLDPAALRRKAVQLGLVSESQANGYTTEQAYALMFLPGFSTREQADESAGRGIGMEIVRQDILALGGAWTIRSEPQHFTEFSIAVPIKH
ncbi:ATP-binding protein [Novosphingobium sp.]|uniref:sensor histidine kinase n=1 Tax=Novosphingobium sp. TaxID=1874826 RepID=UPI003D09E4EF